MRNLFLKLWLLFVRKRHPDLEHFSDESKKCYARANQLAAEQGSDFISSLHLTRAILETPLQDKIDPAGHLSAILKQSKEKQAESHSEGLKKALEISIEQARTHNVKVITPLHLLYGISKLSRTQDASLMKSNGITSEQLAELIRDN